jgi:hypothetical protein
MLYQLSYASPDSLYTPVSKDTKASAERGVQIERLTHAEALCNAVRENIKDKKNAFRICTRKAFFRRKFHIEIERLSALFARLLPSFR